MRAFEAAARTGSYVAAAEEMGVSSAAISQHIRKLEDYLGKQMFLRLNNRIVLTDAGHAIFDGAAVGLQLISEVTEQLVLDRSRSRLVVSAIESVAERWVIPRLTSYSRSCPEFRFDLRVEPDPVDFARHNIDLRIAYNPTHYPEHAIVPLEHDVVLPLCSPEYLERNPAVRDHGMAMVPGDDLLHTSWGPSFASHPTWHDWFVKAKLSPHLATKGFQASNSRVALDLAGQGIGVALGQRMMALDDMAAGRLVALSDITIDLGHSYCLVYPRAKKRKRHLAELIDWFTRADTPSDS
ncbi:LysR family transcriptional regulator [Rhizobium sp. KVB221]|uniref:LysR family transcriptional regulator n=1 Tax=Rhizobium setariae TaxID=2801340 RepID=A0A937CRB5_9HYPH|nr:LysR substrate-binding domain-containing protein [Rhizobium setariae]MBL0374272.1 LysR family transcriptional regulator [Rhizobium setariae]